MHKLKKMQNNEATKMNPSEQPKWSFTGCAGGSTLGVVKFTDPRPSSEQIEAIKASINLVPDSTDPNGSMP
jgi:hypothetical protein